MTGGEPQFLVVIVGDNCLSTRTLKDLSDLALLGLWACPASVDTKDLVVCRYRVFRSLFTQPCH